MLRTQLALAIHLRLMMVTICGGKGHVKEAAFQCNRLLGRKIEAYRARALVDEEVTPQLVRSVAELQKGERKNLLDNLRNAKKRDAAAAASCRTEPDFAFVGRKWFGMSDDARAVNWAAAHGMELAPDRKSASVFVVSDAVDIGNRIHWAVGLTGGCVTCPWQKIFVVYRRALHCKRVLWISDG